MDFQQAESKFQQLKAGFEAGELTETEFKTQLEELMVQDEGGSWWMIGYETEQWYRHDGENWVQADPPGIPSKKITPVVTPEPQADEDVSVKTAPQEKSESDQVRKQKAMRVPAPVQAPKPKSRNWMVYGAAATIAVVLCITTGICLYSILFSPGPITPTEEPVTAEPDPSEEPMEELPEVGFVVMPGGALEQAIRGAYSGTTVTVDGAFEGNDVDGVKFSESMKTFEEATGIDVNYIGNREFQSSITVRVEAGDTPDIADFPYYSSSVDFICNNDYVPVTNFISDEWLSQQYNQSWRDMATVGGMEAGVFHRFNARSLLWYPKQAWDERGYRIPETWDELIALTQQIADDGDTAWCIGIESGAATGWVTTDWTEDMMLRTTSLENYDAWVAGNLAFDSPEVKKAIETWSELWFNDDFIFGGRSSIVTTFIGDSPAPMFDDPPKCWMHKQGIFITSSFPEGVMYGVDYDFFYFPPVDAANGRPFSVTGDLMVMFNDRPEVRALMEYFTVPQSASGWLEGGGALAAHQTATPDMYGVDLEKGIAELVAEATSFRVDGSDLMPREVAAGSFWEQMTNYVAGAIDLDTALQEIDATWP